MQRWTSPAYAAVVIASLLSAALQPGRAEAPAHNDALLALASWGGDALPPAPQTSPGLTPAPARQASAPQPRH
ncbi:MAG: hypothetical protein V4795_11480 [Pseudomonadota bacterium]